MLLMHFLLWVLIPILNPVASWKLVYRYICVCIAWIPNCYFTFFRDHAECPVSACTCKCMQLDTTGNLVPAETLQPWNVTSEEKPSSVESLIDVLHSSKKYLRTSHSWVSYNGEINHSISLAIWYFEWFWRTSQRQTRCWYEHQSMNIGAVQ